MQAAPARYVSVSELYSTDEVELLLDEIRELEPTSCRGEDVQDFEIAGSGGGGGGAGGAGGRSPASLARSWDSHAHYRRAPPPRPRALAPLYCRLRHLRSAGGAASLLLVLCCAGACACVWAGAGLRARVPLAPRVRALLLGALSSLLLHAALLLLHVTRLAALLPLDWERVGALAGAWSAASLALGGALTLHAVLRAPEYRWAPAQLAQLLCSAAALALGGACAALALTLRGAARRLRAGAGRAAYRAVPVPCGAVPGPCGAGPGARPAGAEPGPAPEPPLAVPSTSRDAPL